MTDDRIITNPLKTTIKKDKKNANRHQQEKVREKGLQSKYIHFIIMFEDIMINQYQNIHNYI